MRVLVYCTAAPHIPRAVQLLSFWPAGSSVYTACPRGTLFDLELRSELVLSREATDGFCPLFKEALETYMATAGTHYRTASVSTPTPQCCQDCVPAWTSLLRVQAMLRSMAALWAIASYARPCSSC